MNNGDKIQVTSNALCVWGVILFLLGGIMGFVVTSAAYQGEAINRGFAIYNPTNATFQWKTVDNKPW